MAAEQFHNHPGVIATDCHLRQTVRARTRMTMSGYGCWGTGGHCVPGDGCDDLRARFPGVRPRNTDIEAVRSVLDQRRTQAKKGSP